MIRRFLLWLRGGKEVSELDRLYANNLELSNELHRKLDEFSYKYGQNQTVSMTGQVATITEPPEALRGEWPDVIE